MEISRRFTQRIAKRDHDMLESLRKVGFRTNLGPKETGLMLLIPGRGGGYYLGKFIFEIKSNLTDLLPQTRERANTLQMGGSS